ncbi:hypothetical protein QBC47DRAFT_184143 [Echria macrotheca]|uniref:Trans-sialidase-like protein n=1 Tax=Echria macrotheca TaxID=438768 RepID=A0AAJ0F5Z2_9PEZI|nr:hypothetical protein QBC47DRAFT_184143 [Echria macrotheca]
MSQAPPPPPPHGENPRTTSGSSGLPTGKYDIFIIPEHSAGSGFLYLPSLRPQWNSFIAGMACAFASVVILQTLAPAIKTWWANFQGLGNMGVVLLIIAVGLGSWSMGRTQSEGAAGANGSQRPGGGFSSSGPYYNAPPNGAPPNGAPPNHAPPPNNPPPPPPPQHETPKTERPNTSWQDQPRPEQPRPQSQYQPPPPPPQEPEPPKPEPAPKPAPQPRQAPQSPPPRPNTTKTDAKGAWEKAREETRRRDQERKAKEEERKAREAELKRKEEAARRLREFREREAREREQRENDARAREARERERKEQEEREKARLEKELREKVERELREKLAHEAREREAKERSEKEQREYEARQRELERMREEERQRVETERREKAQREAREKEAREAQERKERLARLERERLEREQKRKEEEEKNTRKGSSYAYSSVGERTSMWPNGKPPAAPPSGTSARPSSETPTKPAAAAAKPAAGTEEPAYSFRPYDTPKKPTARKKSVSDFSESSWAPSASTARTTPPPSMQGAYTTDDPNKIIIKAVYGFLNQFSKTPASQLVSGVGNVTDGLILRITSAGLFIDDDRRGVAQREWDIKAWTIKSVEVWCPAHALTSGASNPPGAIPTNHPFFKHMPSSQRRAAERGATKTFTGEEAVAYLAELGRACQDVCHVSPNASAKGSSVSGNSNGDKTGEWAAKGLHVLRINIRDQEGKRYLFVINEEQGWKIAKGLQTLRGGTQVRALGVAGLSGLEAKTILETLGWGS